MAIKSIEKKFEKRFNGILQFVSDYKDFQIIPLGASAFILPENGEEFGAYFEGMELDEELNCQRVFLQYQQKIEKGPIKEKKWVVTEYLLPLEGKIYLNDFKKNKHKDYKVG
jgi:hypothetical protein